MAENTANSSMPLRTQLFTKSLSLHSTPVCISFYQWALTGCNGHKVPKTEYYIRIIKSVLENKYLGYFPARRDQSHWPGFHGTLAVCSDPEQNDPHYYMKTEHLLNIGFFKSNKYFLTLKIIY